MYGPPLGLSRRVRVSFGRLDLHRRGALGVVLADPDPDQTPSFCGRDKLAVRPASTGRRRTINVRE